MAAPVASIAVWRQGSQGRPSEHQAALVRNVAPPTVRYSKMRPHLKVDADSVPERPTVPDALRPTQVCTDQSFVSAHEILKCRRSLGACSGVRLLSLPSWAYSDALTSPANPWQARLDTGVRIESGVVQVVGSFWAVGSSPGD